MPPVFPFCVRAGGIVRKRSVQNSIEPDLACSRNKGALVAVFRKENGNVIYRQIGCSGTIGKRADQRGNKRKIICLRKSKTNF